MMAVKKGRYGPEIDRDHERGAALGAVSGHTGRVIGVLRAALVAAVLAGPGSWS